MSQVTETVVVSEEKGHKITILEEWCKGCTICVEVCPTDVLKMESVGTRWQGSIAVVIDADACIACMQCELQCPDFSLLIEKGAKKKKSKKAAA
jgi:2-oxoglutarate ferredoxin oxidoreductase subunit delta